MRLTTSGRHTSHRRVGPMRTRRVVMATDSDLAALIERQATAGCSPAPIYHRAVTLDDLVTALRAGMDDLVIDPVEWPDPEGMNDDSITMLADTWTSSTQQPRVVIYSRSSSGSHDLVRRLLAILPAFWRMHQPRKHYRWCG